MMVRRRARIHDVLKVKVKVKGHVIWAVAAPEKFYCRGTTGAL